MSVTWIETREIPVGELTKFPGNAKRGDVKAIRKSIRKTGQYRAIVVRRIGSKLVILAGNHTFEAIVAEGFGTIRCEIIECSDADATRINLADNRLAELGGYDDEDLAALLSGLDGDFEGSGWDSDDLDKLLITQDESGSEDEPDNIPAGVAPQIVSPGDIWALGDHRLLCGDCRNPEAVHKLLDGRQIDLAFTSPPYASQRKYDGSSGFLRVPPDEYVAWFEPVQAIVRDHLSGSGSWFVNIKEHVDDGQRSLYVKDLTLTHVRQWGWRFVDEFAWVRSSPPGKFTERFKNNWEPVLHFSAPGEKLTFHPWAVGHESDAVPIKSSLVGAVSTTGTGDYWYMSGKTESGVSLPGNVVSVSGVDHGIDHPATFPVALPAWFIRAFSDAGDLVFDPFLGSGTTLVAAHRENRVCHGVEISPGYCDVILQRFEAFTGTVPELVSRCE